MCSQKSSIRFLQLSRSPEKFVSKFFGKKERKWNFQVFHQEAALPKFHSKGFLGGATLAQICKQKFTNVGLIRRGIRGGGGGQPKEGPGTRAFLLTQLTDPGKMAFHDLVTKPIVFTALFSGGCFVGATIWQYENHRIKLRQNSFTSLFDRRKWIPSDSEDKRFEFRNTIHSWWIKATPAEKIFWPICAVNACVTALWHIPGLSQKMVTWFSCSPASRAISLPFVLSTFSHYSLLHLGANMFVLHSFIPAAVALMGPEQFVGTYLTAGVLSSFASHSRKVFRGILTPSLGASGAIMGILGYVCMKMPDIELGIIFIPGFTFTADTALKCILAVDTVGLLAGWTFMDHAAHLGGCLYGIALAHFEEKVLSTRTRIMQVWHNVRTKNER